MTTILCIFGTRPEAIKMAPVVKALQLRFGHGVKVCITAQHREMLDQVLALFQITPDYDLDIMQPNQTLASLSSRLLAKLDTVLTDCKPDRIFVHGDTTTTFIAALSAFYHQIPVTHVEAGLRSHQLYSPWPEEANRHMTSTITDCHLAPTQGAANNLQRENIATDNIFITGNTVIDALLETRQIIETNQVIQQQLAAQFPFLDPNKRLLLITGHRRESFGQGFANICQALATLAQRDDLQMIYPVHLNPNVQGPVNELLNKYSNIHLIDPQDYLPLYTS